MAADTIFHCSPGEWTLLTADDAVNVSFQNKGSSGIELAGTVGAVAPTGEPGTEGGSGSFRCIPGGTELGLPLADMFPGVTGVNRLWAYASDGAASVVWISHD